MAVTCCALARARAGEAEGDLRLRSGQSTLMLLHSTFCPFAGSNADSCELMVLLLDYFNDSESGRLLKRAEFFEGRVRERRE